MTRICVGVMGSAALGSLSVEERWRLEDLAERLGVAIAKKDLVLITGETTGLPYAAARAARKTGGFTIGVSGAGSRNEEIERFTAPPERSDVVVYTGFGYKGRNVISVRSSDIVFLLCGSIGTLNEFTIAYDEGKVVGVLTGTGGIADEVSRLIETCRKPSRARVHFSADPEALVTLCLEDLVSVVQK